MAHAYQFDEIRAHLCVRRTGFKKPHVYFQLIFCISIICATAFNTPGQDLGALAREEQARKQSQPAHQGHVYTNDDLANSKILTPEDDLEVRNSRKSWKPPAVDPASDPVTAIVMQPEPPPAPPAVALGDIARQNLEQKAARKLQSKAAPQVAQTSHVYTNEDLAQPQILTPEDHAVFEASQRSKPLTLESESVETVNAQPDSKDIPLGDIARLYRQLKAEATPQKPREFPLLIGTTAFATIEIPKKPAHPPPSLRRHPRIKRVRQAHRFTTEPRDTIPRLVTVKPGDSLWKLAREYLRQGHRWRSILQANPSIRDPDHIRVGVQIRI